MLNQFVLVGRLIEVVGDTMFLSLEESKGKKIRLALKLTPNILKSLEEVHLTPNSIIGVKGKFNGQSEFVSIELVVEKLSILKEGAGV